MCEYKWAYKMRKIQALILYVSKYLSWQWELNTMILWSQRRIENMLKIKTALNK